MITFLTIYISLVYLSPYWLSDSCKIDILLYFPFLLKVFQAFEVDFSLVI